VSALSVLRRNAARSLLPAFMLAALLTGGASLEGEFAKAALFVASGLLLGCLFLFSHSWAKGAAASVLAICVPTILVLIVQIVPLPVRVTENLPLRSDALTALNALGIKPSALPISLERDATFAGIVAFLAPLAGFCLVAAIKWSRGASLLKWIIPLLGGAGALMGLAQVLIGKEAPWLYLHEFTSRDLPVGVFANPNHQASFLLMCLPFIAVLASEIRRDWEGHDEDVVRATITAVLGLMILAGVFGAGSAAGYILLAPVLLFSLVLFLGGGRKGKGKGKGSSLIGMAALPLVLGFAALVVFTSPRLTGLGQTSFEDGPASRIGINRVSARMIEENWVWGTGLGSYEDVFRLYEDPGTVSSTYIAHAHNDYFEWVIETGIAGTVLLAVFLAWWMFHFVRLWLNTKAEAWRLRRAAAIACLVPVLHSLVDYPLRTPAIAVLAAICLALMVVVRARPETPLPKDEAVGAEELRVVTL